VVDRYLRSTSPLEVFTADFSLNSSTSQSDRRSSASVRQQVGTGSMSAAVSVPVYSTPSPYIGLIVRFMLILRVFRDDGSD